MLTKQQFNIFSVFQKDIFAELTFRQIKEQSKQKSNNIVQLALKEFLNSQLLNTKKTGDVTTYSLNLGNNLTLSYLNLANEAEIQNKKLPGQILNDMQKKILKHTEFFILLIFGSYAKGKAAEKSDLDIAIIANSEKTKKEITPFLETIKRREIIHIDYHIFTRAEFIDMLRQEQENLGKQIYKSSIIYYGFIQYCSLIRSWKNG